MHLFVQIVSVGYVKNVWIDSKKSSSVPFAVSSWIRSVNDEEVNSIY